MKKGLLIILIGLVLGSCEKDEIPVAPHEPGDVVEDQVEMNSDYRYQLFYSLEDTSIVSQNLKTDWDLGFESGAEGWHLILNTALGGGVANTQINDFEAVADTAGLDWNHDAHSGNLDSTAFGDYRDTDNVFVLDRGFHYYGYHLGFMKVKILAHSTTDYTIRMANLNGSADTTFVIEKDENLTFTAFSIETLSVADIFPDKETWDLMFTQYLHIYIDPPQPYLVTGVLINRNKVEVAFDDSIAFESIDYINALDYYYSTAVNTIGFNWKKIPNVDNPVYEIYYHYNYIISGVNGSLYKLRFVSFYNDAGQKGTPNFEFQRL